MCREFSYLYYINKKNIDIIQMKDKPLNKPFKSNNPKKKIFSLCDEKW